MTLYIDCCARKNSATRKLAQALLEQLGEYEALYLYDEDLRPIDEERLAQRDLLIGSGSYDAPMFKYARQWANADTIVIAAPFWDLSFPSLLKTYVENIYVTGLVSKYGEDGTPVGLCKAERLYFVTTAGGKLDERFGYGYIKTLATDCFGIKDVRLIKAEMMDVDGFDREEILNSAIEKIKSGNF